MTAPSLRKAAHVGTLARFEPPDDGELEAWLQCATRLRRDARGGDDRLTAAHLLENAYKFANTLRAALAQPDKQTQEIERLRKILNDARILSEYPAVPGNNLSVTTVSGALAPGQVIALLADWRKP